MIPCPKPAPRYSNPAKNTNTLYNENKSANSDTHDPFMTKKDVNSKVQLDSVQDWHFLKQELQASLESIHATNTLNNSNASNNTSLKGRRASFIGHPLKPEDFYQVLKQFVKFTQIDEFSFFHILSMCALLWFMSLVCGRHF